MPRYTYQCTCGLKFDANHPVSKCKDPSPCPSCKQPASRLLPTELNSTFRKDVTGPGPQNTGISSLDAHIDRVIGQHSQQGWRIAESRYKLKKQTLANNPGATGNDLSRNPDGSYRVLEPEEKGVFKRAHAINSKAMSALKSIEP